MAENLLALRIELAFGPPRRTCVGELVPSHRELCFD